MEGVVHASTHTDFAPHDFKDIWYTPWCLFLCAFLSLGRKAIMFTLFFFMATYSGDAAGYAGLHNCSGPEWDGQDGLALYCKTTKAFVRSFPLTASAMAVLLTGRSVLLKITWAEFLNVGVLLQFESQTCLSPNTSPAFYFVLLEFTLGFLHYLLYIGSDDQTEKWQVSATAYLLPGIYFLYLFYCEYYIEQQLSTLNEYCLSRGGSDARCPQGVPRPRPGTSLPLAGKK